MPQAAAEPHQLPPVIYTDLDGTLIRGDALWEGIAAIARSRPLLLFAIPFWLFAGRAAFKQRIASAAQLRPETLPWSTYVVDELRARAEAGCGIVLATAAAGPVARAVAQHLGIFREILASSPEINLCGEAKLAAIEAHAHNAPFEYWGDSAADLPVFARAAAGTLVYPGPALRRRVARVNPAIAVLDRPESPVRAACISLRPHHWVKNLLLFVPMITAHRVLDLRLWLLTAAGFGVFSLVASAHYLINDLLDLPADRLHPKKRFRPLASGALSIPAGISISLALLAVAAFSLLFLPRPFAGWMLAYFALTTLYSTWLKHLLLADVVTLSGLYAVRVIAGGAAGQVPISTWLIAFCMFFFTSLAFTKRFAELRERLNSGRAGMVPGRGYTLDDLGIIRVFGPVSGLLAILVLALYITSPPTAALYQHPRGLWALCLLLGFWIMRIWFLANRGELDQDPAVFALHDPASLVVALGALLTLAAATF